MVGYTYPVEYRINVQKKNILFNWSYYSTEIFKIILSQIILIKM